ncbi:MAG TPA: Clp protease N-terminal domain-containing protein [Streptosporangiaceae bacterium]|nr:Clp protease N-terminal domain-containing protein [Streptosporangiaceae bacterium]
MIQLKYRDTDQRLNGAAMFERFDPDARAAIAKAREEAARAGRREIGTEHLLLGLMDKPGDATDALEAAAADPDEVRAVLPQVEATRAAATEAPEAPEAVPAPEPEAVPEPRLGEQARAAVDLHLTRNARRALDLALRSAHRFRHDHVSSGHLLLSIIEQPDSGAVEALKVAGIHVGTLRTDILKQLTEAPAPARPARPAPPAPQPVPEPAPTQD